MNFDFHPSTGAAVWPPGAAPKMMAENARMNRLLAALPPSSLERWLPHLELIDMPLGQVLYGSGIIERYAYFPITAIVSLLYITENGNSAEVAVVGREGLVGISLFLGGNSTPSCAVVLSAGMGFRLPAKFLKEESDQLTGVAHLLLRYTQALMTQMAQIAVCNRHHSLDQRLCRWLLLNLDRLSDSGLVMTQDLIARMLGVRREGVTEGAIRLQKAGLVKYVRGHITVLDRPGLEKRVCECYAVVKGEYDRLLPLTPQTRQCDHHWAGRHRHDDAFGRAAQNQFESYMAG